MKKKALVVILLTGLISLTSCMVYPPSSVDYEGSTWKNEWYQYSNSKGVKDLHVCGIKYDEEKEPLFVKNKYNFWSTNQFTYNFLYAEYIDSQFWNPDVYIKEEQLEEAKAFYQNKVNYNYYIGPRFDEKEILVENEEQKAVLDYVIDVIMGEKTPKTITVKEDPSVHNLACFRRSKDGLFMTYKEELIVYGQSVYYLKVYDGSKDNWTAYDLGENGTALYTMFKDNNLI